MSESLHLRESRGADAAVILTARQPDAIRRAVGAVRRCAAQAAKIGDTIDAADVLAFELREALDALGSVCGSVTTDDLLGRIFSSFCIGK